MSAERRFGGPPDRFASPDDRAVDERRRFRSSFGRERRYSVLAAVTDCLERVRDRRSCCLR